MKLSYSVNMTTKHRFL